MLDMSEVYDLVYPVRTKWNSFGLQLKMNYDDLTAIKKECREDPEECLKELLSRWLKRADPKPTWKALVKALKSKTVGFGGLAQEVKRKYDQV